MYHYYHQTETQVVPIDILHNNGEEKKIKSTIEHRTLHKSCNNYLPHLFVIDDAVPAAVAEG